MGTRSAQKSLMQEARSDHLQECGTRERTFFIGPRGLARGWRRVPRELSQLQPLQGNQVTQTNAGTQSALDAQVGRPEQQRQQRRPRVQKE